MIYTRAKGGVVMPQENIKFNKGSYRLNRQENYNFQLNRVVMWNGGELSDVQPVAERIIDSTSWKRELIALGDKAISENRVQNAIAYYRMSEFFMYDEDPDKLKYYRLAKKLFYQHYAEHFESRKVERLSVPYEGRQLPVMHADAVGSKKDTILLHGGNDSYFEEFFFPMLYFAENGFEVYLFEGPGQGGVVREQGMRFTSRWEKPVKAVLDAFALDNVTIIGASLGSMLALRAAAFDDRLRRVICWSIFPHYLSVAMHAVPRNLRGLLHWMLRHNCRGIINGRVRRLMTQDQTVDWAIRHGMFAYEARTPFDCLKKLDEFQMIDIGDKVTQDVLVIGAEKDHFIPKELYKEELDALTNVRSLTYRLFTAREHGEAHCNVGNPKLCFDTMMSWIEQILKRDDAN